VLLALCGHSAWALQPLITDDTGTQGAAGHQLELAWSRDRLHAGPARDSARTWTPTYTYGATDTLDLFASLGHTRLQGDSGSARGWGNAVLGAKWRLWAHETAGTSLALKPELVLPVSAQREAQGLGTARLSGQATAILSQELPFGALHANLMLGRERHRDPDAAQATLTRASLAPVWNLGAQWKLVADLGVEQRRERGSNTRTRFAELGAIYSPHERLDWAVGMVRARADDPQRSTATTLTAGLTWRFGAAP
jgi:hypothetical protein